jgi:hypothetical protein
VEGKGRLDLADGRARLHLTSARVAGIGLPGFLLHPVETGLNSELASLEIESPLFLSIADDRATLTRIR